MAKADKSSIIIITIVLTKERITCNGGVDQQLVQTVYVVGRNSFVCPLVVVFIFFHL